MQLPAWIVWLDRRFGGWSVPHLVRILVAMNAGCVALDFISKGFVQIMFLDPEKVLAGEWWRVLTFLFASGAPEGGFGILFLVFGLVLMWKFGEGLEMEWGSGPLNLYILITALLLIVVSLGPLQIPVGNSYIAFSLLIAFATLYPDYELMLFPLPIPIKIKWIALLSGAFVVRDLILSPGAYPEILAGLASYILFFGGYWFDEIKLRSESRKRMKRFRGED